MVRQSPDQACLTARVAPKAASLPVDGRKASYRPMWSSTKQDTRSMRRLRAVGNA